MGKRNFTELLKEVSKHDLFRVGGKAVNLGEMIKVGLPVPKGFVLVIDSYKKFTEFNNIRTRIEELLMNLDNNEYKSIKKASIEIKNLLNLII